MPRTQGDGRLCARHRRRVPAAALRRRDAPRCSPVWTPLSDARTSGRSPSVGATRSRRTRTVVSDGARSALRRHVAAVLGTPGHLAYVKIAEGCDNRCAYCTIPSIRGRAQKPRRRNRCSREASISSTRGRGDQSHRPGHDRLRHGHCSCTFLRGLLDALADIGVPWIRVLYTHPAHVTDELLSARQPRATPSCRTWTSRSSTSRTACSRRWAGGPTAAQIRASCSRACVNAVPDVSIRSSVMVGFPGETESGVRGAARVRLRAGTIDHLGVFEFSPEEGTPALRTAGRVDRRPRRFAQRDVAAHEQSTE